MRRRRRHHQARIPHHLGGCRRPPAEPFGCRGSPRRTVARGCLLVRRRPATASSGRRGRCCLPASRPLPPGPGVMRCQRTAGHSRPARGSPAAVRRGAAATHRAPPRPRGAGWPWGVVGRGKWLTSIELLGSPGLRPRRPALGRRRRCAPSGQWSIRSVEPDSATYVQQSGHPGRKGGSDVTGRQVQGSQPV